MKNKNGKELKISYPCVMLNVMVAANNTNEQYQDLVCAETREYRTSSQMSIEFEVDGPYKVTKLPNIPCCICLVMYSCIGLG